MYKHLIILFLVCALFPACQRKGCTDPRAVNYCNNCSKSENQTCYYNPVTSYHLFWFNKSTSDSLSAYGVDTLDMLTPTGDPHYPTNHFVFPVSNFYSAAPACSNSAVILHAEADLTVNDPVKNTNFSICVYKNHTDKPLPAGKIWGGPFSINYNQCGSTQLIW